MSNQTLPELGSEVMQDIYRCAIQRYPNEACGFLVRTQGEKYRFMEAMNVSETPREDFVMRASDIIAAEDAGTLTLSAAQRRQTRIAPGARRRNYRG